MSEPTKIKWRIAGEEFGSCNCPEGFEYKEAAVGNTVHCRVRAGDKMMFEFGNATAQLNAFDWSN